jgi:D-alanyl-lipoteichoic acid acyltransferase DltB (MBOAT superfamily)
MLFNSPEFLLLFLPIVVIGFYLCRRVSASWQILCIIGASLFFYGYWRFEYLPILLFVLITNYSISRLIQHSRSALRRKVYFIFGVVLALSVLGYYKYSYFFFSNVYGLLNMPYTGIEGEIPIGISFYTFTAIAFLTDVYTGRIRQYSVSEYGATITYFPHLVAGPILFHHDTIPQLRQPGGIRFDSEKLILFLFFFSAGLFKKTAFADSIAQFSDPIFAQVANGGIPNTGQAWRAALCYTLQLYYDFSGYSDMAIGLACLFGIKIPVNFYSPYKSLNVAEFWQKWHISLGYFLKTYLYIPFGGSRKGTYHTLFNLFLVMFLCGIWHGAGWTFIAWGAMHGIALLVQRIFRHNVVLPDKMWARFGAWLLTFVFVVFAWVVFRCETFTSAIVVMKGMVGLNHARLHNLPKHMVEVKMAGLLLIALFVPNTHQIMKRYVPAILLGKQRENGSDRLVDKLSGNNAYQYCLGAVSAILLVSGVVFMLVNGEVNYLYFDF